MIRLQERNNNFKCSSKPDMHGKIPTAFTP
ncbi:hypothetical protein SAMN05421545_1757 [Pontibacter lucknowensis]|uniref:Uncharacterized protein n=1 Tax=Pontibacter lucknowensis TaxID=1077936 RepID=A0A1N6WUB7_9BACT|nr:hypothetical protein SAMN05421545_1757 [Pontibacter lucknowensis]